LTIGITKSASEEPERTSNDERIFNHPYNGAQNKTPIFLIRKLNRSRYVIISYFNQFSQK